MTIKLVNKGPYNLASLCNAQINSMVITWWNEDPVGDVLVIVTYREDVPPDERTEAYMKQPSQQ